MEKSLYWKVDGVDWVQCFVRGLYKNRVSCEPANDL